MSQYVPDPWTAQQQGWTPSPAFSPPPPPRRRRGGFVMGLAAAVVVGALGVTQLGALAPGRAVAPSRPAPTASAPAVPGPTQTEEPVVGPGGTSAAVAALSTGVVLIESQMSGGGTGAGTGMVLTADGQVLTNYHVVEQSTAVQVTIATSGETYTATVIGHDATRDVALLQLTDASGLQTVTLDDDPVSVGDQVTAVGNSKGAGRLTSASGSVLEVEASITVASETDPNGSESLTGVIATDASAVPGDSGGPMYDAEGEVLGMTTAGSQTQTRRGGTTTVASFAVPIATAMKVVNQVRTGQSSGSVIVGGKAYLGVSVASGTTVTSVSAGTPAASAGLAAGDRITALNGTPVASQAELAAALGEVRPGDRASLSWTDTSGAKRTASVVLATSPVN